MLKTPPESDQSFQSYRNWTILKTIEINFFFWLYLIINAPDFRLIPLDRNTYMDILLHFSWVSPFIQSYFNIICDMIKQVRSNGGHGTQHIGTYVFDCIGCFDCSFAVKIIWRPLKIVKKYLKYFPSHLICLVIPHNYRFVKRSILWS